MNRYKIETPLVSICMPTYNHANYIEQAIKGVLFQQTNFSFELCLGEDESSDGTREICVKYAEQNPETIRLFLRSRSDVIYINGKPTGSYNFLETLKACCGKYIALCEGDDYWTDPFKLQKQVDFLEHNPEFSICFHSTAKRKGRRVKVSNKHVPAEETGLKDIVERNYIRTVSAVFRNNLPEEFPRYFYTAPYTDHLLHCYNAQFGKIKYLDETMAVYRIHRGGFWSAQNDVQRISARIRMREIIAEMLAEKYPEEAGISLNCSIHDREKLEMLLKDREKKKGQIRYGLQKWGKWWQRKRG